jgi:hypothetical protein
VFYPIILPYVFRILKNWVQRFSGTMVQLHEGLLKWGLVVRWLSYTMVQFHGGSFIQGFSCTVVRWFSYTHTIHFRVRRRIFCWGFYQGELSKGKEVWRGWTCQRKLYTGGICQNSYTIFFNISWFLFSVSILRVELLRVIAWVNFHRDWSRGYIRGEGISPWRWPRFPGII